MNNPLPAARPRLAMVEDEGDFLESALDFLRLAGYAVWGAGSGEEFERRFASDPVDVVVLDVGLPGESGFEIAQRISAERAEVGIVIVSARSTVDDRLTGLGRGADSFLVKPVDFQELIAHIEAVWRRLGTARAVRAREEGGGAWALDRQNWVLSAPGGERMKLTSKEFALVRCLVAADGELVGKAAVAKALGGTSDEFDYHRIDVLLSRLRKKGQQATGAPLPIKTIQSYGYAFTAPCLLA